MTYRTSLRTIARQGWREVYLTLAATSPAESAAAYTACFDDITRSIADQGMTILQEKVFGLASTQDAILAARGRVREHHGLREDVTPTFIEGRPCVGGALAGIQIVGAIAESSEVRIDTLRHQGRAVGRSLRCPGQYMVFLSGISGYDAKTPYPVTVQAERMFENVWDLLRAFDLEPRHVVRTWIYLPRLLDWYGEFNRVRTRAFKGCGIIDADGQGTLPASTGIQGRRREGEECFMDVLAVVADQRTAPTPMHNTRQNEASEYGSSFSRGMAVNVDDRPTLWVSGTASIDSRGRTVHHGDEQGQVMETLLAIASLLEGQGASLRDICQATAYCKRETDYAALRQLTRQLGLEDLPFLPVYADVCRDELLFEVDSVAVKGHAQRPAEAVTQVVTRELKRLVG